MPIVLLDAALVSKTNNHTSYDRLFESMNTVGCLHAVRAILASIKLLHAVELGVEKESNIIDPPNSVSEDDRLSNFCKEETPLIFPHLKQSTPFALRGSVRLQFRNQDPIFHLLAWPFCSRGYQQPLIWEISD